MWWHSDNRTWWQKARDAVEAYTGHVIGFVLWTLLISAPAGLALWFCYAPSAATLGLPLLTPWQMIGIVTFVVGAMTTIRVALRIRTGDLG